MDSPPLSIETVIEKDGKKQAQSEGEVGMELTDDLPRAQTSFVGVGSGWMGSVISGAGPLAGTSRQVGTGTREGESGKKNGGEEE